MLSKRLSLFLIFLLLNSAHLFAATLYARANGNWNTASTWSYFGRNGISCGCTPGAGDDVIIYTRDVSVTNGNAFALSVTISNDLANGDFDFIVENGYTLTVGTYINVVSNNNNDDITILIQDNNSAINVGSNLTVNMDDGENVFFEMTENTSFLVNGNISIDMAGTSSSNVEFNLSNDAGSDHLHVNGNFYFYKNGARDIVIDLTEQSEIYVGGNFIIDWDNTQSNGDQVFINLEDDASFTAASSAILNMNETGNTSCDIIIDLNDDSRFEVGTDDGNLTGSLTINIQDGRNTEIYCDYNSSFVVYGNASILHNGTGNVLVHLNTNQNGTADVQMEIDGDFTISKTNGEKSEFFIYQDADVIVGGDFSFTSTYHLTSGKDLRLEIMDNATLDIDGSMTMQLNSQGNTGNDLQLIMDNTADLIVGVNSGTLTESCLISVTQGTICTIEIDRDATMTVYGDLSVNHAGSGDCFFRMDENSNGSGADAQVFIYGDATFTKTSGDEFKLDINRDSDLQIDGNLDISITGFSSTGENVEVELNDDSGLIVEGNFTYSMNASGNTSADLMLDMNNNAQMVIGSVATPTSAIFQIDFTTGADGIFILSDKSDLTVYGDLTINKTGGSDFDFDSNDDVTIHIYQDLILNNSENADLLTFGLNNDAIGDIDGDINLSSTASAGKVQFDLNNNAYLYFAGNFLRSASPDQFGSFICNSASTLELDGNSPQVISEDAGDGSDYFYYLNLVLNNSSGSSPQFTVQGDATIHESLDFQDGVVSNSDAELLIIVDNATVSNASHESHVAGYVKKEGNDDFTFPVGSLTFYRPIGIEIISGASSSDAFVATYFDSDPDGLHSDTLITNSLDHISSCEYWDLDLTNGNPTVQVTLSYEDYNSGIGCSGVENPTDLRVSHWNGSLWDDLGNGGTTGSLTTGTITSSIPTSTFSPFTLASSSTANPLPVELLYFQAQVSDTKNVELTWKTASEFNNAYFLLERSIDGLRWDLFDKVTGAGTKQSPTLYSTTDPLLNSSTIYYRLTQVDFNGEQRTYDPILLSGSMVSSHENFIYPNPTKEEFYLVSAATNSENIELFTLSGQNISDKIQVQSIEKGKFKINTGNIPSGSYFLKVNGESMPLRIIQ